MRWKNLSTEARKAVNDVMTELGSGPDGLNSWQEELRRTYKEWQREAAKAAQQDQSSSAPITVVGGSLFGSSIHLNDSFFDGSLFGIPCVVCHGMTSIGRVGPVNSFRFPGGAGQLQMYQGLRDTTAITSLIAGLGFTGGTAFAGAPIITGEGMSKAAIMRGFFKGGRLVRTPENIAVLKWYLQVARDALARYEKLKYTGVGVATQTHRIQYILNQLRAWGLE